MRSMMSGLAFAAMTAVAAAQSYSGPSLTPRPGWATPPNAPRPGWAAPPPPTQYYTTEHPHYYVPDRGRGARRCYWVDDLYGSRRVCE